MRMIGIVPARFGSTRFPGKPLALIAGKPLLQWVVEGAKTSRALDEIIVATDDERIFALAKKIGVRAVMTDSQLPTGTDRIWQAAEKLEAADVVVNIQGDEPLVDGALLDRLVAPFLVDAELDMATLGRELDQESLHSINTAKIILNAKHEAIYFSRFAIPFTRVPAGKMISTGTALKHIGIYAYRRDFLKRFCATPPATIEISEGLEQLRALYLGARIKVVQVEHDSWGVDTPEDVAKIESIIRERMKGNA